MKTRKNQLKPLLKYPGGKTSELLVIFENAPDKIETYIEPFVGGGAVYFSIDAKRYAINDISSELMLLYKYVKTENVTFFKELDIIIDNWEKLSELASDDLVDLYMEHREQDSFDFDRINPLLDRIFLNMPMFDLRAPDLFNTNLRKSVFSKFNLIKKNEIKKEELLSKEDVRQNLEAGIKAAYYTYLRDVYNNPKEYYKLPTVRKVAIYFFIREYCFSSMFRFNRDGGFNVPYGGISYNKKTLDAKKTYFKNLELRKHLQKTQLENMDFFEFLHAIDIAEDDFMFLDPPYDTTFSEYDKNEFGLDDQRRLANYLINECPCKFQLIIKKTDFIESLYENRGLYIMESKKTYFVNFMGRTPQNEKEVVHLIITNYRRENK